MLSGGISRPITTASHHVTGCDDIVIRHGLVKDYVWNLCKEKRDRKRRADSKADTRSKRPKRPNRKH